MGCSAALRCLALGAALSLSSAGGNLAVFAASSTGTASATVVGSVEVGDGLFTGADTGELRIRLPGLAVLAGPATVSGLKKPVQVELEAATGTQCGESNPCCNPPSGGRLAGDPASSLVAVTVLSEDGAKCRLTVMYN
jgi:hypothetical protein